MIFPYKSLKEVKTLVVTSFFFILLLWPNSPLGAQKIRGVIVDIETGERIPGATILDLDSPYGTYADEEGYFSLTIRPETRKLIFSSVGYRADTIMVDTLPEKIELKQAYANVVVVKGTKKWRPSTGYISPNLQHLSNVPMLAGETDLLKGLTLFPGITTGVEGTAGVHVRGGSDDQNLYLLDGSPIYNPSHIFGFLSLFQPLIVKKVNVFKGYAPAKYGGRLSSVIDVHTVDGNTKQRRSHGTIGTITNSYHTEGPLKISETGTEHTFLVAGRTANTVLLTLASLAAGGGSSERPLILAGMYDFNAKVTFRYPSGMSLSTNLYLGDDFWGGRSMGEMGLSGESINWGNKLAGISAHYLLNNNWVVRGSINLNHYGNRYHAFEEVNEEKIFFENRSSISELASVLSLSSQINALSLEFGIEGRGRRMMPLQLNGSSNNKNNIPLPVNSVVGRFFIDAGLQINSKLHLHSGLAASSLSTTTLNYSKNYLEPRLNLSYDDAWGTLGLSLSRNVQNIHRVASFALGLPYDIWIPANRDQPLSSALEWSVEFRKSFAQREISLGLFTKKVENLVRPTSNGFLFPREQGEETRTYQAIGRGIGKVVGLEFFFQQKIGKADAFTLAYTFTRSERSFAEINNGNYFDYDFNRPHVLTANYQGQLNRKWNMSVVFNLQSGRPVTTPVSLRQNLFDEVIPVYDEYNNSRLPAYHRLDLAATKQITTKRKEREASLSFSIYNIYGRANPVRLFVEEDPVFVGVETEPFTELSYRTESVLRFIPSISYSVKW